MLNLGENGRFGNQIFQYIFLYNMSQKSGHTLLLPLQTDKSINDYKRLSLLDVFDLPNLNSLEYEDLISPVIKINETKPFHYDETVVNQILNNPDENINVNGYFQSYKYVESESKTLLKIKPELIQTCQKFLEPFENKIKICLHIRRGDMVGSPNHHLLSEEYNWRTINYMREKFPNCVFIVFSEDINYCKNHFQGSDIFYSSLNSVSEDFVCMTLCDHHIINASSFSWWGAYLSETKGGANETHTVIAPSRLFHKFDKFGDLDVSEYYPHNWILFDDECRH